MISSTNLPAIPRQYRTHRAVRLIAVVAAAGSVAAAMAGCSSSAAPKATSPATSRAIKQIKLAADTSQHVNSLTASLTVHSVGKSGGNLSGTIQMQMKPTSLIEAEFLVPSSHGKNIDLDEILTSKAIYFKDPAFLSQKMHKAWVKVKISQLSSKSGLTFGSLLQNLEGSNPLDQTKLFTASKDVRQVGTDTVHGVPTTEYAGTYAPKAAYSGLTPRLRKLIGPMLRSIGTNPVHFRVWIDAQHLIKKADYTETVRGQTVTTTFVVTSINQPVHVTLPKADQTAPLPSL